MEVVLLTIDTEYVAHHQYIPDASVRRIRQMWTH